MIGILDFGIPILARSPDLGLHMGLEDEGIIQRNISWGKASP